MKSIRELFALVDQWKFASWTARSNAVMAIILAECVREHKCDHAPLVVISGGDWADRVRLRWLITECDQTRARSGLTHEHHSLDEMPRSRAEFVASLSGFIDNDAQFINWDVHPSDALLSVLPELDYAMTGRVGKPLMVVVTGAEPVRLPANFRPSVLRIELA